MDSITDSLVWAKMKFCPYWPAKLVETPPQLGKTPRHKVCVLFMGTKQYGFIPRDNIESYIENRERFVKKGKGIDFRKAVQHMDEYISDGVKFRSHAYVNPRTHNVQIKTEQDVERELGIKVERSNHLTNEPNVNEPGANVPNLTQMMAVDSWDEEKKSLIDNVMALRSENQSLVQKLNGKDFELNAAIELKQELDNRLREKDLKFSTKLNELKGQLQIATKKDETNMETILALKRENASLVSQNRQLIHSQAEKTNTNEDSDDDVYEVERLLDDKLVEERHYLVRWKGYDESEDSWERESNLRCSSILKKYKQSKKR